VRWFCTLTFQRTVVGWLVGLFVNRIVNMKAKEISSSLCISTAGSIPDGVIGIFHGHNPSGRTMALGLTHPLTEMSTRIIFRG
jgi:hypothetical protein